jgi:hypothetical protein
VVAADHPGAACSQKIDNVIRVRPEVHHIPGDNEGVYAKGSGIGEDSTQGNEIAMHIGEDSEATWFR